MPKHIYETITSVEEDGRRILNWRGCKVTLADGTALHVEPMSANNMAAEEGGLVLIDFETGIENHALVTCFSATGQLVSVTMEIPLEDIQTAQ